VRESEREFYKGYDLYTLMAKKEFAPTTFGDLCFLWGKRPSPQDRRVDNLRFSGFQHAFEGGQRDFHDLHRQLPMDEVGA
jgi:hypothetical protein